MTLFAYTASPADEVHVPRAIRNFSLTVQPVGGLSQAHSTGKMRVPEEECGAKRSLISRDIFDKYVS